MTRLGIFGGSFDPPHNAHLEIATLAIEQIPLDTLYFIPSYQAPLKSHPPKAPARHRLAMVKLLAEMRTDWEVLPYEIEQERMVTTIETVEYLKHRKPRASCYLVIGGDQAAKLHQWQQWKRLTQLVNIVCFTREGPPPAAAVFNELMIIPFANPLSSSLVREQIRAGDSSDTILPQTVLSYIQEHQLYL